MLGNKGGENDTFGDGVALTGRGLDAGLGEDDFVFGRGGGDAVNFPWLEITGVGEEGEGIFSGGFVSG